MRASVSASNSLRLAIASVLLASSQSLHASGFALLEQSASRLGTAFAGSGAFADDATTIFFNPAGLVYLERPQAIVIPSGVLIESQFQDRGSLAALGQMRGDSGGDAGGWNLVPSAYASLPLNEKLSIGIGINAPFGLKTEYDHGWVGRFQALKSAIQTINANPTVAYRLNDIVSIGVGVNYQTIQAELTNSVNYTAVVAQGLEQLALAAEISPAAIPGLIAANAGLEGHARVRGDDHAWGFNIGFMFDLGTNTRISLAYRSSMEYTVEGSARFIAPNVEQPQGAAIVALASMGEGPVASGPAFVDLELPDSAILSVHQQFGDRFALAADIGWTGWSSVQELRVVRASGTTLSVTPEHWEDAWRVALGGAYALNSNLTLRAGVAHDESAVPDSTRTPRLPDTDRTWVAIGARWQASDRLTLDAGYAHLFSDDVPINQNDGNTNVSGLLLGEQKSSVDIVSVQFTVSF